MLNVKMLASLLGVAVRSSYHEDWTSGRRENTGVLLSGGIDSSTVACLAPDLPVFTGYYRGRLYDERPWAAIVAEGREWHEIEITPQDFIDNIDACLDCLQPPFEGPGTFGQYMVAKYVSKHVDVVLSGEGGDELFGGYARLYPLAGLPMPEGYENYSPPEGYPTTLGEALDWEWAHLPALLRVDEQVTRAHGLTARAPMAEYQPLIDFVMEMDDRERVAKAALKKAMRGIVPDDILNRPGKMGFPVPFVEWAQGPLYDFIWERIGYVPDKGKPWDRQWWLDLCESSLVAA